MYKQDVLSMVEKALEKLVLSLAGCTLLFPFAGRFILGLRHQLRVGNEYIVPSHIEWS